MTAYRVTAARDRVDLALAHMPAALIGELDVVPARDLATLALEVDRLKGGLEAIVAANTCDNGDVGEPGLCFCPSCHASAVLANHRWTNELEFTDPRRRVPMGMERPVAIARELYGDLDTPPDEDVRQNYPPSEGGRAPGARARVIGWAEGDDE